MDFISTVKIDNIKQNSYIPIKFSGNKFSRVVQNLSACDYYRDTDTKEFRELRIIYNNLWDKMGLPQNLKPKLQYKAMFAEMSFSPKEYVIKVEKRVSPFKMRVMNKSGKNEALLRHEIEHVMQIWNIIRLLGADKTVKEFNKNIKGLSCKNNPAFFKKIHEIEQTLGRISPASEEGNIAKCYLVALKNYPDLNSYCGPLSFRELKKVYKYYTNILEVNARKVSKNYEPGLLKTIKIMFSEFYTLLFSKNR